MIALLWRAAPYIAAILFVGGAIFGIHYHGVNSGRAEIQAKWDVDKLARADANNKAILAAVAANEATHQANLAKTQKVIANYETAINAKNAAITAERRTAERLRLDRAAVCSRPAATSQAAGSEPVDDSRAPATVELPQEVERRLLDSAEDADREVARLQSKVTGLQAWIMANGFYGPAAD